MIVAPDWVKDGDLGVAVACEDESADAEIERLCRRAIDHKAKQEGWAVERYSTEVTSDDEDGSRVLLVVGHAN